MIEDSATPQSELDSKSLEENVPENEQFENINLDGIFKNSSSDASAAEEVREDTPKDFDEEEIDNGQPTVPENYEEELEIVNQENVTDERRHGTISSGSQN